MTIHHPAPGILRGVLWDLFGTLIRPERAGGSDLAPDTSDTFEAINTAHLVHWAAAQGLPTPPETAAVIREARRWMWAQTYATGRQFLTREALARAGADLGWPQDPIFFEEASRVFFAAEVDMVKPFREAAATLAALREMGLRQAVVSNASEHHLVTRAVERTGLREFFDPVISSAGFGRIKPDAAIFRAVLDAWGLPAEQCAMVGDSLEADIAGAQAVGLRAILVTMDPNPANALVADRIRPDAVAASLAEVVPIIRRWMEPPD